MKKRHAKQKQKTSATISGPTIDQLNAVFGAGDWPNLEALSRERLRADAGDAPGHQMLGFALYKLQKTQAAVDAFEMALLVCPNNATVMVNYAFTLAGLGQYPKALALSQQAAAIDPNYAPAWIGCAANAYYTGNYQQGVDAANHALTLHLSDEERGFVLNNLSINLRDQGKLAESIAASRLAIEANPTSANAYGNLILQLQSDPHADAQQIRHVCQGFSDVVERPFKGQWSNFENVDDDPLRRLKIGFLSPNLNQHAVMYFMEGLLTHFDRRHFEIHAFYLYGSSDQVTQRVQREADFFHHAAGLDDSALAERIKATAIDILIDLAGHTDRSGVRAMAQKPAPVQVTWLGYPGTVGLSAIDWRITDPIGDPIGAESEYVERLYRLPNIFCVYRPMIRSPLKRYQPSYAVKPPPALTNGFVTFGCCNALAKVTDQVLSVWAEILNRVPNAKLLIEAVDFAKPEVRSDYEKKLSLLGIDTDRLILIIREPSKQYLPYHYIDIALDPFPLTGGTTSFDLLWMGVPLVTLTGPSFRNRMGISILTNLGHPEWIAKDKSDYVNVACALASDVQMLHKCRLTQRTRMEQSPLMDEKRFTQHFEDALRHLWFDWCARRQHGQDESAVTNQIAVLHQGQPNRPAQIAQVVIGPGEIISLNEAQQRLQLLTQSALAESPTDNDHSTVTHPAWLEVLRFAEVILDSIPNEALALTTLAELEHAHGHTEFASTYLKYAMQSMQLAAIES